MIKDLEEAEGLLQEAMITRSERYKLVQDMTVSATKAAGILNGIKSLTKQITEYQNKVNEIKRAMNYHEDDILKTEKKQRTVM